VDRSTPSRVPSGENPFHLTPWWRVLSKEPMRSASNWALISSYLCLCSADCSSLVIGSSLAILSTAVDGVKEDDEVDEDDDGNDGPTGRVRMCCRSNTIGEQRRATRGAGRLLGLLVGPGLSVNSSRSGIRPGFGVARHAT
jgi:hypothetical protein